MRPLLLGPVFGDARLPCEFGSRLQRRQVDTPPVGQMDGIDDQFPDECGGALTACRRKAVKCQRRGLAGQGRIGLERRLDAGRVAVKMAGIAELPAKLCGKPGAVR